MINMYIKAVTSSLFSQKMGNLQKLLAETFFGNIFFYNHC